MYLVWCGYGVPFYIKTKQITIKMCLFVILLYRAGVYAYLCVHVVLKVFSCNDEGGYVTSTVRKYEMKKN